MEFDKSKVYTALNADELKVDSKVILADSLGMLRTRVEGLKTKEDEKSLITTVREIKDRDYQNRFVDEDNVFWNLAYLISEPEEKKLKWTDLKLGDIVRKKYGDGYCFAMVTRIDTYSTPKHIELGDEWVSDEELENWEKVE